MKGDLQKYVIEKIVEARKKMGLTQKEMAKNIGVSQSYYNQIEKGDHQIKLDLIEQLEKILNVPGFMFLYNEDTDQWIFDKESELTIEAFKKKNELLEEENRQWKIIADLTSQNAVVLNEHVQSLIETIETKEKTISQLYEIIKNEGTLYDSVLLHNEQLKAFCKRAIEQAESIDFEKVKAVQPDITKEEYLEGLKIQRKVLGLDINHAPQKEALKNLGNTIDDHNESLAKLKSIVSKKTQKSALKDIEESEVLKAVEFLNDKYKKPETQDTKGDTKKKGKS